MSFAINAVSISGNMTRDAEVRALPSGASITNLSIAWNERRKNQQTGEYEDRGHFFEAIVFGKQGEWLAEHAKKGDPVALSGTLEQQRWQDKTSGDQRSKVSIVARDVFLGQRAGGGSSTQAPAQGGQQSAGYGASAGYESSGYGGNDRRDF